MLYLCIEADSSIKYDIFYAVSNNKWNYRDLSRAKEILLFAEEIDVYKAYDYGLVNFYSDNYDQLLNKVDEFTENIENIALHRLQTVKKLLNINQ